jgi:hypothetical protein
MISTNKVLKLRNVCAVTCFPSKEQPTIDYVAGFVEWLHDTILIPISG